VFKLEPDHVDAGSTWQTSWSREAWDERAAGLRMLAAAEVLDRLERDKREPS